MMLEEKSYKNDKRIKDRFFIWRFADWIIKNELYSWAIFFWPIILLRYCDLRIKDKNLWVR